MNKEEFKKLFECEWKPSEESIALDKAFDKYYRESEFVDDLTARKMWSELKKTATLLGVTSNQFFEAKMRATGRIR